METFRIVHAGTVYRVLRADTSVARFFLVESGWAPGHGEWVVLGQDEVAWSYLAEKMPVMGKREGDKEGWIMAFAKAGLEVFG